MADVDFVILLEFIEDEEQRHNTTILRRELRDQSDPLNIPEVLFQGIYRLSRQLVNDLILEIAPQMENIQRPEIAIPQKLKIMAALHFMCQGSYQKSVGQDHLFPMSQSSVSRCVADVTTTIVTHMNNHVRFPISAEEKLLEKQLFMDVLQGFPGIIGAIDCTQIAIQSPSFNDLNFPGIVFLNRKGFYSLNVQIICNANLKILSVNARYPGSVHDSAIWTTSLVQQHLRQSYERGDRSSWLIGDSRYPLQPWLMIPISAAAVNNREEGRAYNIVHKRCRNVIERLNGVLKARFRCLLRHRTLHYNPVKAANIVNTCAILHNLCLQRGEHLEKVPDEPDQCVDAVDRNIDDRYHRNWLNEGKNTRERILTNYF